MKIKFAHSGPGWKSKVGFVIGLGLMMMSATPAMASGLTYSANTTISLTSPAISLTIVASSTATSVNIGAGSVIVSIGSGDSFTLTSASRDLDIGGGGAGVAYSKTCSSSSVATIVLSSTTGSTTFTVTPASSACASTTSSTSTGNSLPIAPVIPPAQQPQQQIEQPQIATPPSASLNTVHSKGVLLAPAKVSKSNVLTNTVSVQPIAETTVASEYDVAPALVKSLKANMTKGAGVKLLQKFLNENGFVIAKKGTGSPGKENTTLGAATKKALKKFQKAAGIKQTGKVDSATLKYLKSQIE